MRSGGFSSARRVLPQLLEGGVEVGVIALVLPGEVAAFPDVGPALAAGVLLGAAFEAVLLAGRISLRRCWLIEEPTKIDEVLLRGGAFLEFYLPPLGDELVGCQVVLLALGGCARTRAMSGRGMFLDAVVRCEPVQEFTRPENPDALILD